MTDTSASLPSVRPRLQLSLGAVAELGEEIAGVAGRRRFAAVTRQGERQVVVTLHAPSPIGPDARALQRRIDAIRDLEHPTLELPLACGDLDGCAWVVDRAPSVKSVADQLTVRPLPLTQAVSVIRDLTRAVAAMHRREITHGAIDLDVVGLDRSGVRLGGLGLSLGGVRRDDLDALGLIAWSLLSGDRRPTAVRPLSQLRRGVPPELDALCASLVAANPSDRPQRAEEILDALDAVPTPRRNPLASIAEPGMHDARPQSRRTLGWVVACVAILMLAGMLVARG